MPERLIIVGGGQAAAQAVQSLRQQNFAGSITPTALPAIFGLYFLFFSYQESIEFKKEITDA